jgi:hypothetical protein
MAKYFNFFPKTLYSVETKNNALEIVTNITSRFAFESSLKDNSAAFYPYDIKDSDTPEIIASKFYGNPERHWIILLFNDIIDPQWDWPLEDRTFNEFVDTKYSSPQYANTANSSISGLSFAKNVNNTKSYFKIITTKTYEKTTIEKIEVDDVTYNTITQSTNSYTLENNTSITVAVTKERQSFYDYELELNESKRSIKLLKSEFVPVIEKEFKRVIKQ